MATVWIPPLVQTLTGGEQIVEASGQTVREVFDNLEARYPGLRAAPVPERPPASGGRDVGRWAGSQPGRGLGRRCGQRDPLFAGHERRLNAGRESGSEMRNSCP